MNPFQDAFISYGRADSKEFAQNLHRYLVNAGLMVWFDFEDIPLGVDYQKQIDDGIEKADNFIFIISPHSINSPYCGLEVQLALQFGKRIIPLLHVERISRETWQTRNPQGTDEQWSDYTAAGKHDHFANMHPVLRKINWIYCREDQDDVEKALKDLQTLLQFQKEYVHQHTRLLGSALEWERHHKQTEYLLIGDHCREGLAWLKTRFTDCQSPCSLTDLHSEYIVESLKNSNNLMTQVFISYSENDREVMYKIRRSLWREGITVWTNLTDIKIGDDFQEMIYRGIVNSDNIVYLLSPASLASFYCQDELNYGLSLNKRIIPILVDLVETDILPDYLKNLHYIDLIDNEEEADYLSDESQLFNILSTNESYHRTHKILLAQAMKWEEQHRNATILLRGYNLRQAEIWMKTAKDRSQYPPCILHIEFIEESLRHPPADSLDVFISYSRSDSDFARYLNENLQIYGKLTWFDQESIPNASADFQKEINQGIQASNNFLFILSPRSIASPYCAEEVNYAASLNKRILTLLLHPINVAELHPELAKVQWIDFSNTSQDFWEDFNQLIRALDTDREHLQSHTRWSQRSIEWQHKNRSRDLLLRGNELILAQEWLNTANQQNKQPSPTELQQTFITESDRQTQNEIRKEQRQKVILRSLVGVMTGVAVIAVGATIWALKLRQDSIISEIKALSISSNAQLKSGQSLDALITALEAGRHFQDLPKVTARKQKKLRDQLISTLSQVLSLGNEFDRLEEFDKRVLSIQFSPDSQFLIIADGSDIKIFDRDTYQLKSIGKNSPKNIDFNNVYVVKTPEAFEILSIVYQNSKPIVYRYDFEGQPLPTLSKNLNFKSIKFIQKNNTIITYDDQSIDLWELGGKLILKLPKSSNLSYYNLSDNGEIVWGYNEQSKQYIIWTKNGSTWEQKSLFLPEESYIKSVTPDRKLIVADDEKLYFYNFNGKQLLTIPQSSYNSDSTYIGSSINYSPNQKIVAIFYNNLKANESEFTVKLWSLDGQFLASLQGHDALIRVLKFSPDGKYIATASNDKTIKLWDVKGKLLNTFLGHGDWVNNIEFDSKTETLVSGSDDATVRFWTFSNSQNRRLISKNVTFNLEGTKFVSVDAPNIQLHHVDGNEESNVSKPLVDNLTGDATPSWSDNGQTLITTESENQKSYGPVKVWDAEGTLRATLIPKHTTDEEEQRTIQTDVSPDGEWILTALHSTRDYGPVQLWKADGTLQKTLIPQQTSSNDEDDQTWGNVQFNPWKPTPTDDPETRGTAENLIATTLQSSKIYGPVQVWNTRGDLLTTLQPPTALPQDAATDDAFNGQVTFSENGATIVSSLYTQNSYGPVTLWNQDSRQVYTLIPKQSVERLGWNPPVTVQVSADGQRILTTIATPTQYGPVTLWNAQGSRLAELVPAMPIADNGSISGSNQFSPDGQTIAASVFDGTTATLKLWKATETLTTLLDRSTATDPAQVVFSQDSQTLITGVPGGSLQRWTWSGNGAVQNTVLIPNLEDIWNLVISPDGTLLAVTTKPTTLELWDLRHRPERLQEIKGRGFMMFPQFSPDNQRFVVSNYDNQLWVWQRVPESPAGILTTLGGHEKPVDRGLYFDPQQNTLAAVDAEGVLLHELPNIKGLDLDELLNPLMKEGCDRARPYLEYNSSLENPCDRP